MLPMGSVGIVIVADYGRSTDRSPPPVSAHPGGAEGPPREALAHDIGRAFYWAEPDAITEAETSTETLTDASIRAAASATASTAMPRQAAACAPTEASDVAAPWTELANASSAGATAYCMRACAASSAG